MAKKTINKELTGAQDLYNFLFEACNIIRGPVSQDSMHLCQNNIVLLFLMVVIGKKSESVQKILELP